jgi:hypothetical protein
MKKENEFEIQFTHHELKIKSFQLHLLHCLSRNNEKDIWGEFSMCKLKASLEFYRAILLINRNGSHQVT